MATLNTNESPRFENGAWKWYEDNTFSLSFNIKIPKSQFDDGDSPANYTYDIVFHRSNGEPVHKFTINSVTATEVGTKYSFNLVCVFTSAISKKFIWGKYTYCIKMKKSNQSVNIAHTLYANGEAEVESCH